MLSFGKETLRYLEQFGLNKDFFLPNFKINDSCFPTQIKIKSEPFEAAIEKNGDLYFIEYSEQKLSVKT